MDSKQLTEYIMSFKNIFTIENGIGVVTVLVCSFIYVGLKSRTYKCAKSKKNGKMSCINEVDYIQPLCNYTIKASYSSCALGNFRNNYVDLCALKNVIKQGCRFLDFQVFSVKGDPVVAVSSVSSYNEKGSYNSIPLDDVIHCIKNNALATSCGASGICPNPYDPLILHFRINSNEINIYNKIASSLSTILMDTLLDNRYSLSNNSTTSNGYANNIWTTLKLGDALGKAIIMINGSGNKLEQSKLYEVANVNSDNGAYTTVIPFQNVNFKGTDGTTNTEYYSDNNKLKMNIVVPTSKYYPINYNAKECFKLGIQVCCMCFQKENPQLKEYNAFFNKDGKAFIPKNRYYMDVPLYI